MQKQDLIRQYIDANPNCKNVDIAIALKKEALFKYTDLSSIQKYVSLIKCKKTPKTETLKTVINPILGEPLLEDSRAWIKEESELRKHKEKNSENEKRIKILAEELDIANKALNTALLLDNRQRKEYEIKPEFGKTTSEATAFMVLSDIHLEERVDGSTINNLNEFNLAIAKDSVHNFFKRGARLTSVFSKDINIKNIVVAMLGDIISGYIHEELLEDNYLSPVQSIMLASDLLSDGINFLLKNTKCNLTLVCKVGNHGRISDKKKISTEYKNSFEWLLYHQLKKEFRNEDRVEFIIDNGYLSYLDVYGRTIRFHHGHNIKFGGGMGGIVTPVSKAISQWDKQRHAYLDVFGHFHTLMLDTGTAGKFVSNGSIVGYNAFAVAIKATYDEPKQAFFLIDKHRGKTITAPIFVR
jgi:hypothetical protein